MVDCINQEKIHLYPHYDQNDRKPVNCKNFHLDMTSMEIRGQKYYNSSVSIFCVFKICFLSWFY